MLSDEEGQLARIGDVLASPRGAPPSSVHLDAPSWIPPGPQRVLGTVGAVLHEDDVVDAAWPMGVSQPCRLRDHLEQMTHADGAQAFDIT